MLGELGCTDHIYILDIKNKNEGWIKSRIKCPAKSQYKAMLTTSDDIHLFGHAAPKGHYSIPVSSVLSSIELEK